jgi:hypothetical protein
MKNIKNWNGGETFIQMDNIMTKTLPSIHKIIWETIENGSTPSQETITRALILDLFGFIPNCVIIYLVISLCFYDNYRQE